MNSHVTAQFRKRFEGLPSDVQHAAEETYRIWHRDPFHASLQFKEIRAGIWSGRIGLHWRALARQTGEDVTWFWIGSHADYDRLI